MSFSVKLVYGPFGQSNMHSTLDVCPRPDHPKKEIRVRKLLSYILCLNPTEKQIFRNAKMCAKKAFYTVHSARTTYILVNSNGGVLSALCNAITATRIVSNSAIASVNKCSESFENSLLCIRRVSF